MTIHTDTPHDALAIALQALTGATIARSRESAWASSGFSGWQHRFVLDWTGHQDSSVLHQIKDHVFDLPGHVVVDIAMVERDRDDRGCRITIEALTVGMR